MAHIKNGWKGVVLLVALTCSYYSLSQAEEDTLSDWDRTFMPAIQMGYVGHGTNELSGGLMVQTSIEYRDVSNFVFRINFDDFNSSIDTPYPLDSNLNFTGRTSFSELIGGIGYRDKDGNHNFTAYVQGGVRFYGYPLFIIDDIQANLDLDSRNVGVMRYSLGYEFMLAPKLFLTLEALVSHTLEAKDYWENDRWSYGITLGVSAPLF